MLLYLGLRVAVADTLLSLMSIRTTTYLDLLYASFKQRRELEDGVAHCRLEIGRRSFAPYAETSEGDTRNTKNGLLAAVTKIYE
jgi:hypothetical protein